MKNLIFVFGTGMLVGLVMTFAFFDYQYEEIKKIVGEVEIEVENEIVHKTVEKNIIEWNDWECEEIERSYTDLLQPSGLWGMTNLQCQRLEKTIEELCKEEPEMCKTVKSKNVFEPDWSCYKEIPKGGVPCNWEEVTTMY